MSAIRVRSRRLRSLLLVVGAYQSPGRSAASFSSSDRAGSGGSVSRAASQCLLGLGEGGEFGLPPGFQAAGHQPVVRFDRVEGAFGAVGLVAGAFDGELGGPADPLMPVGDLVGGGQREMRSRWGSTLPTIVRPPPRPPWRRRWTGRRGW